ncbi:uncharacterized protein LACBIDRAFT_295861 [Laccaria bicolor S238N-H82]|uniref:Predicted protein n=1 Tax=Laccaria bicolor (strain S238N-H82 / ATCC MYA-4686) TaxID=486041 RepID=B0DZP9_LACBS|nr:uncharacterized protein LACBIDRAFT_295861 [Laccaria bicolor S238N-H82]EDQ99870.1 predicted protein [Laccaria bicolor S238N-H82]|eukprot:XP_001889413.1 predicted protein [Laccaria bicolor S238N-H82]
MLLSRSRLRSLKLLLIVFAVAVLFTSVPWLRSLLPGKLGATRPKNTPYRFTVPKLPSRKDARPRVDQAPTIPPKKVVEPPNPVANRLGQHKYRPDGLVEVNEEGVHPIYELISRAEKEWQGKLDRASKTLDQAVAEYRRRYSRAPPKGFELWWDYVQKHNVQLPDEYDQMHNDLEPFWGLEPPDLFEIQKELEKKKDSYTLGKTKQNDPVSVLTYAFDEGRYDQLIYGSVNIVKLFREIQDFLPPFRATFSPHDGPNRLSDYAVKLATLEAAHSQSYVERAALPKINSIGWISACAPSSPARRRPIDLNKPPPPPSKKTFIYNHFQAMDPCLHPDHLHHHGQFLSHNTGPTPQQSMVPEFSSCSTTIHHNIRIPTPYGWVADSDDPAFDDKFDERLLWRGSNTGMFHATKTRWRNQQRIHLVRSANDLNGTMRVIPPDRSRTEKIGEMREVRRARLNPAVMDVAFAGNPIACSKSVCPVLEELFEWRDYQREKEAGRYKYIIDVDGNGWSGRFKRLMTTNALVFKSTIYPEWYTDRVAPWVHYIPIQLDLSDLHDALLFFRGDANGDGAHEDMARKIAVSGREWSKTFWRKEDLTAYFFRLMLEYARLMSPDRKAMSYKTAKEEGKA